jgi:O-6-methylguanine DNA methyltransferase
MNTEPEFTEDLLRSLDVEPPSDLHRDTVLTVGAADSVSTTDSPIGPVWISWSTRGVTALTPLFATPTIEEFFERHRRQAYEAGAIPGELADVVTDAMESLDARDVPIDMSGLAPFQQSVLAACSTIPVGHVRPYGWIASEIHNPGSVRAVGTALGHNPIPILVPCHRVVRSDGSVGQYAFGPDMKHDLLVREGALLG